jgi:hypothetical protein
VISSTSSRAPKKAPLATKRHSGGPLRRRRTIRGALCVDPWVAAACVAAPPAFANGRYPASNALVFAPGDPDTVLIRTTFGVLVSRDSGASWDWLCEDALGVPAGAVEDPSLAATAGGALVAGTAEGLDVSADLGCDWRAVGDPSAPPLVRDLTIRANAPHAVLALTSTVRPDAGAGGGAGYLTQVWESVDDGAHWVVDGAPIDPTAVPTSLEVAASDPRRIYVSAYRGDGPTRSASIFVSADQGAHWTERPVPIDPNTEAAALIAAVDPANADLVYVRTQGRSRLLVTSDGGGTYVTALTLSGPMLGFALTPDGSRVYAGGPQDGVFVAKGGNAPSFVRASDLAVECLAARGASELWACAPQSAGFFAARSTDDGARFEPVLLLDGVRAPIACATGSTASQCTGSTFSQLCATLPGCGGQAPADPPPIAPFDTGVAFPDAGAEPRELLNLPTWACGCSAAGGGSALGLFVAFVATVAAWGRRRMRAKRPPRSA